MKDKQLIIGLGSKRKRGKNIVASCIKTFLFGNADLDAFASSIKESCRSIFGLSWKQIDGELKEEKDIYWNKTPRQIMQEYGSSMRETFGEDIWVKSLERRIKEIKKRTIIVSDVRFINEALMLKKYNAYLVRVDREIPYDPFIDDHQSEIDLDGFDDWDFIIKNNGSLEELRFKVNSLMVKILEKENKKQQGQIYE